MTYTIKDWQDSPSTATPISAAALEDLEARVRSALVVNAGNLGSTYTYDLLGDCNVMLVATLDANVVITITGLAAGAVFRLVLTQDVVGGHTVTITDGLTPAVVAVNTVGSTTTVVEGVCPDSSTAVVWVH